MIDTIENIEVIGGANCRFCVMAKTLLESRDLEYKYRDVREEPEAMAKLKELGLRTIPQIWVDGKHIGDYTELHSFLQDIKHANTK